VLPLDRTSKSGEEHARPCALLLARHPRARDRRSRAPACRCRVLVGHEEPPILRASSGPLPVCLPSSAFLAAVVGKHQDAAQVVPCLRCALLGVGKTRRRGAEPPLRLRMTGPASVETRCRAPAHDRRRTEACSAARPREWPAWADEGELRRTRPQVVPVTSRTARGCVSVGAKIAGEAHGWPRGADAG
jgi:hypothetical protein